MKLQKHTIAFIYRGFVNIKNFYLYLLCILFGKSFVQFEVEPAEGGSRITQTAVFRPLGLGGLIYWYGLYPTHWVIFRQMLKEIARRAVY
ncbi:MAG: DUF2867 domain-containing protein [Candidatus Dadabacteria bacterium]|nr:DUF2867 domain-containing protein [Candidatus Dadabacteria bacterium]